MWFTGFCWEENLHNSWGLIRFVLYCLRWNTELHSQSPLIQRDCWVGISLTAQLDVLSVQVPISIKPVHRNIWLIWCTNKYIQLTGLGYSKLICKSAGVFNFTWKVISLWKTYTECRAWRCQWRPPRCRWWHRWASPCVCLCWAPKHSRSERWTSRLSFCILWWSLLPAPLSPTCSHQQGIMSQHIEIQKCRRIAHINNTHTPDCTRWFSIGWDAGGHWCFQIGWTSYQCRRGQTHLSCWTNWKKRDSALKCFS